MGLLTASSATGQMVFLPLMAYMVEHYGWRSVAILVSSVAALAIPLVAIFLPERPQDIGMKSYGQLDDLPPDAANKSKNPLSIAFGALGKASKIRDFWLLFFSFFICDMSTNGYIDSRFIAMCGDYGISAVGGPSILAMMGLLDLFGTTMSGWLSDRFNARRPAVLVLRPAWCRADFPAACVRPELLRPAGLFALFYGLDWIATVPPTVHLANAPSRTDHIRLDRRRSSARRRQRHHAGRHAAQQPRQLYVGGDLIPAAPVLNR